MTVTDRLDELLVLQATDGLDSDESRQLDQLLEELPSVDALWVARLLGELDAELVTPDEQPLPSALVAALRASGPEEPEVSTAEPDLVDGSGPSVWSWVGWAAAAAIAFLAFGPLSTPESIDFASVAAATDAVEIEWASGGDPTGVDVSGSVVWSASLQQGVMRFAGLEANDPSEFQYQLWIFDAERDERYPVDGGVFDVPAGETSVDVVIEAALDVSDPVLFAVTVERPGGVVVSDRSRIATLAQASE